MAKKTATTRKSPSSGQKPKSTPRKKAGKSPASAPSRVEGSLIGGNLVIRDRSEFVGRDKTVTQTSVDRSQSEFRVVYEQVAARPDTSPAERADIEAEVRDIEAEVAQGDQADESFLMRRLRSLERMAPDILEVVLATLANPTAGFGMVASKVAKKIAESSKGAHPTAG
jgi:hypothetical protein